MNRFANFLRSGFAAKPEAEAVQRVKAWVTAALDAHRDTALAVNEIACADPSCPGIETVILIMEPGRKTRACKVQKPIEEVTEEDVRAALASAIA